MRLKAPVTLALIALVFIGAAIDGILLFIRGQSPSLLPLYLERELFGLPLGLSAELTLAGLVAFSATCLFFITRWQQRDTRGRARTLSFSVLALSSALARAIGAYTLHGAIANTVEAKISFDFGDAALYFTLTEAEALLYKGAQLARVLTDGAALGGAFALYLGLSRALRARIALALDLLIVAAFIFAITALELEPNERDPASLARAIVRLSITALLALRLALRLVGPALRLIERASFEWMIPARHLRSQKSGFLAATSLLSILAVAVSCAMLTTVLSVMGGFRQDLKDKILGQKAHLLIEREEGPFTVSDELIESLSALPGVEAATPYLEAEVMLTTTNGSEGAILRGIALTDLERGTNLSEILVEGELDHLRHPEKLLDIPSFDEADEFGSIFGIEPSTEDSDSFARTLRRDRGEREERVVLPPLVLGRELAQALRVYVGDELEIVSPHGRLGPTGRLPKTRRFRVAGIFYSGMYEYDMKLVYLPIDEAARFLGSGEAIHGVEIRTRDAERAPRLIPEIKSLVAGTDLRVRDWRELNQNLFGALALERLAMFLTLGLAILIAGFSVFGTFILLIQEKSGEIAVLRTLGASTRQILRSFILEGLMIGTLGSILGLGLGYLLVFAAKRFRIGIPSEIFYIDHLPVHAEPLDFLLVGVASIFVCVIATIFPAEMASRLRPVDSLRHE